MDVISGFKFSVDRLRRFGSEEGGQILPLSISDDSIYQKYPYIVFDIDISYCIVSSKKISNF